MLAKASRGSVTDDERDTELAQTAERLGSTGPFQTKLVVRSALDQAVYYTVISSLFNIPATSSVQSLGPDYVRQREVGANRLGNTCIRHVQAAALIAD